jgi:nucleoside-diphosphate-sugar epimerase
MHILVIGGTRFLGRALVDAALGHGHNATGAPTTLGHVSRLSARPNF